MGSSAHYYKFTGVTEIQCWTLSGERPGSPRNEEFHDKLRNEVPIPRTQGHRLGGMRSVGQGLLGKSGWLQQLVITGHGFALPLGYCTGSIPRTQMWLYPSERAPP